MQNSRVFVGLSSGFGFGFRSGSGFGAGFGAGFGLEIGFGIGSILNSLSSEEVDELELSPVRRLGLNGFVVCQVSSGSGKAPGGLQGGLNGGSGCLGEGEGVGSIR